ncbi:MAG TPA: sulfatase [Myxococcota bacterium]|nr:sulfatase [Myxococcota bacterium]
MATYDSTVLSWTLLLSLSACGEPAPGPPNVLVVSIDTLRADRVGRRDAEGRSMTPNLDAFARDARVFESAWSQANETLYSHASVFTGLYPSEMGELDYATYGFRADQETMAAVFSRSGYATEAVVAGGHLAPEFGLGVGFQRYASGDDFGSFQQTVPLALERIDVLEEGDRPWLMFVHGYDVHAPYLKWGPLFRGDTPGYNGPLLERALIPWTCEQILDGVLHPGFDPQNISTGGRTVLDPALFDELETWAAGHEGEGITLGPEDEAFVRGLYDGSVRYADYHVGVLLAELEDRGLSGDTVVVVMSDHGEDLLDHGHVNHRSSLHDENIHVALMLRGPGIEPGAVATPVGLVDILPTLAGLSGVRVPETRGQDLLSPDPDRVVYSEAVLGTVSLRSAEGRLAMPHGSDQWPEEPPPGAFITGPHGEPLSWSDPLGPELFAELQ